MAGDVLELVPAPTGLGHLARPYIKEGSWHPRKNHGENFSPTKGEQVEAGSERPADPFARHGSSVLFICNICTPPSHRTKVLPEGSLQEHF